MTLANDDQTPWHHMASPGHNELKHSVHLHAILQHWGLTKCSFVAYYVKTWIHARQHSPADGNMP